MERLGCQMTHKKEEQSKEEEEKEEEDWYLSKNASEGNTSLN
jgi:hypothetical protein